MLYTKVCTEPAVYMIPVPFRNISTSATNCYAIEDAGEWLIVDTGAPSEEGLACLRAAFAKLGIDGKRVSFFLTHFHIDHAGLLPHIAPPAARVYISARDAHTARTGASHAAADALVARLIAEGVPYEEAGAVRRMRLELEGKEAPGLSFELVEEGYEIAVGRYRLKVVDTAGHTEGHMSLFEPVSGSLFCGDHVLYVISPSIDVFSDGSDSYQTYLGNLAKVRALPLERVFVSHGENRADFVERIDWLVAHHEGRLEEIIGIVRAHPNRGGYEIIKAIRWNVPFDAWEEISLLQRGCILCEGLVMLDHLVLQERIVRCEDPDSGILCYSQKFPGQAGAAALASTR